MLPAGRHTLLLEKTLWLHSTSAEPSWLIDLDDNGPLWTEVNKMFCSTLTVVQIVFIVGLGGLDGSEWFCCGSRLFWVVLKWF